MNEALMGDCSTWKATTEKTQHCSKTNKNRTLDIEFSIVAVEF